jgi:hypothetical protein
MALHSGRSDLTVVQVPRLINAILPDTAEGFESGVHPSDVEPPDPKGLAATSVGDARAVGR